MATLDMFTEHTGLRLAEALEDSAESFRSTMQAVVVSGGTSSAVTSAIITDTATGKHYALTAENGHLNLLEVASTTTAHDVVVLDVTTGKAYKIVCTNGQISLEEA